MGFSTDASAPTSEEIYDASKLKWAKLKFPDADSIDDIVEDAIGYFTWITGRYFDDYPPASIPYTDSGPVSTAYTPVPVAQAPELIRIAKRTVQMCVEQAAIQAQVSYLDTAADDIVQSFTAGAYSETRRDPTRRGEQKMLNSWPGLNLRLFQLMTDERREYWNMVLGGGNVPAFEVEEVDWSLVGKSPLFPGIGSDPMAPQPPIGPTWWE